MKIITSNSSSEQIQSEQARVRASKREKLRHKIQALANELGLVKKGNVYVRINK